jgi:AmpD protein
MIFAIDADSGWLRDVNRVPSPNCDERPTGAELELIVVHSISLPPGEYGGTAIDAFFTNTLAAHQHPYFAEIADLHVSAHVVIKRDGELTQFVPFTRRAWHAGESEYCGRACCNDFSVGIELEGVDDGPFTDSQYAMLADLVRALEAAYPSLRGGDIVGHSDIAPGRKTDPGPGFDWQHLAKLLSA